MNQRPKVLIVDDELFNIDYLQQELEECNYDLITATNGRDALDQIRNEKPDLVLLDLMMPVVDGFAVLRQVKADPDLREIPIIIISAANNSRSVVKGIKLGAEDYITKPINEKFLLQKVREFLG
jgi:two-component system sensor histidine kinase/response regulator